MLEQSDIKKTTLQSLRLERMMLKEHQYKVIKELHGKGKSKREIAGVLDRTPIMGNVIAMGRQSHQLALNQPSMS
jgi:hypothetical protein